MKTGPIVLETLQKHYSSVQLISRGWDVDEAMAVGRTSLDSAEIK